MKITYDPEHVGLWVCARGGGKYLPGRAQAIGLMDDAGELKAGVLYEDFNGAQVVCHISGEGNWATNREFLWQIFDYPFNQLKVKRVTVVIAESNQKIRTLVERLGFEKEFVAEDAHPDGALLIYKMKRDQCRWLALKGNSDEIPALDS